MTDAWLPVTPPSILLRPALGRSDLRGRRVQIGQPGSGWRRDLRADAAVVQGSRTYVPVLSEQEWYRAEAEQTEVFAALVPVDRVWAEVAEEGPGREPVRDLFARLVSLDVPSRQDPVPAREVLRIAGRRVVRADPTGERRDLRATTEAYQNDEGDICVRITTELDWYRWGWSGQTPKTMEIPVFLLWLE